MKRDMELVREILLKLNEYENGFAPNSFEISGYSDEQVGYHCFLLNEAGLIEAADVSSSSTPSPYGIPIRMTWEGHEFIENAQNDKVWVQTKEAVAKLGDVSFSVWASVLSQVVLSNLGLNS
ncbi:MAG: DUF2513 domain-containing protein [Woeseia sp.]